MANRRQNRGGGPPTESEFIEVDVDGSRKKMVPRRCAVAYFCGLQIEEPCGLWSHFFRTAEANPDPRVNGQVPQILDAIWNELKAGGGRRR